MIGNTNSKDGDVTTSFGNLDYLIIKVNSLGVIEWKKSYGGSGNEQPYSIIQTTDGGYIVGGYSDSKDGTVLENHGSADYWVLKLDVEGVIEWQKSYGGSDDDRLKRMKQTTDGGYISAGYTHPKIVGTFSPSGVKADADFWLVKLGTTTPVKELGINPEFKILPNPATNTLLVDFSNLQADELIITDVIGRNYFNQTIKKGEIEMQIDVSDLVNGVWFISLLKNGKNISNQKFIIQQ